MKDWCRIGPYKRLGTTNLHHHSPQSKFVYSLQDSAPYLGLNLLEVISIIVICRLTFVSFGVLAKSLFTKDPEVNSKNLLEQLAALEIKFP